MILCSVLIKAYFVMTFATTMDEVWNIHNPRPNPKQKYYALEWEPKDFYSYKIDNEWVLRKHRKTDSETKKIIREQYWKERNERSNRRN